jgi:dTDP-4-amino-4,6-dideoxygalactose transaminase/predicted dehydrogenase
MAKTYLRNAKTRTRQLAVDLACRLLMRSAKSQGGRAPFDAEELKLVREALLTQNLNCINGRMVPALEREFAMAYGVPYAVASSSGTAALHVALGALDLNPGDEIITAPITDLGTIIPILYQGAIPVFADIDQTYNIDPSDVERKISANTRAIIAVHLFGNPCDMAAMVDIARRHKIPLIEDASQAHMARYQGRLVGTIGDIGCFSFQQSKQMATGDGGMTITSNPAYFERMQLFVDKGWARKGWGPRSYLFHAPNYRMTELVGAVGLAQLRKVRAVVERRRELGRHMSDLLAGIPGIDPAPVTLGAEHAYWLYPITLRGHTAQRFADEIKAEQVAVLPGYIGDPIYLCSESLHAKKTYGTSQWPFNSNPGKTYTYDRGLCPRAEEALKHLVCVPWNESWTKTDVERVARAIQRAVERLTSTAAHAPLPAHSANGSVHAVAEDAGRRAHKLRVGIVGCGQIGRWHLDAYKRDDRVEVIAVVDTDLERAERFARAANAKAYGSHKAMLLNEKLDGASICTVPSTHLEIALDLLGAGIHVLCEKPLATSVAEAEKMMECAEANGRRLVTAFKFRFQEEVLGAKELIDHGRLGKILNFRLMFGGAIDTGVSWRAQKQVAGGGVIMDNGPHAVDLIHYLFGDIEGLSVDAGSGRGAEVEDSARLNVRTKDGNLGVVDLGWSIAVPSPRYLEIYGSEGTAFLDADGLSYRLKTWNQWKRVPNQLDARGSFARQITHFVDAISRTVPESGGDREGLKSQIIIEAAYRSLAEGAKVSLTETVGVA